MTKAKNIQRKAITLPARGGRQALGVLLSGTAMTGTLVAGIAGSLITASPALAVCVGGVLADHYQVTCQVGADGGSNPGSQDNNIIIDLQPLYITPADASSVGQIIQTATGTSHGIEVRTDNSSEFTSTFSNTSGDLFKLTTTGVTGTKSSVDITTGSQFVFNGYNDAFHVESGINDIIVDNDSKVTGGTVGTTGDWNAYSLQSTTGDIKFTTTGDVLNSGGNQANIWIQSNTGNVEANILADVGVDKQSTGGEGLYVQTGFNNTGNGSVAIKVGGDEANGNIYGEWNGIVVGQRSGTGTAAGDAITITNDGTVIGYEANGILVSGYNSANVYRTSQFGSNKAVGDVSITNRGHIEGVVGNGATINTTGNIVTTNSSFQSWIGAVDGINATGNSFDHDNSGGLVWGKAQDGLDIHDIAGVGYPTSVSIDNTGDWTNYYTYGPGGIIAGGTNGILINDVALGDIVIDNFGQVKTDIYSVDVAGGLIFGYGGSGIAIDDVVAGSVTIDNRNTFDPRFHGVGNETLNADFETTYGSFVDDVDAGIYGDDYGIIVSDVTAGLVSIDNRSGIVFGDDQDGINVTGAGGKTIDVNSVPTDVAFWLDNGSSKESTLGGLVWGGGDEGVRLDNLGGAVFINNGNGAIAGYSHGIQITNVDGGDVNISSSLGGLIQGLNNEGIFIDDVSTVAAVGGNVTITNGGNIFADDRAAYINNIDGNVTLTNSGNILGEGSTGLPVIRVDNVDGNVQISNTGLIASTALPGTTPTGSTPTSVPAWALDSSRLSADLLSINDFVFGGVRPSDWTSLNEYSNVTDDLAVNVDADGTTTFTNDTGSVLVGRVDIDSDDGTTIINNGTWLVRGDSQARGTSNGDTITNNGLIQTALNDGFNATASFRADTFTNVGTLSMADGGVGDETAVNGNFVGSGGKVAIDVDFLNSDSDFLDLFNGNLTGQTGVIVRIVNTGGALGDRIEFANYENLAAEDAFVLDVSSDNYVAMGSGGIIADGLLAWYVDQDGWNGFDLVADWGPGAYNAPGIITTAQAAFQSGLGIVEDHMYGKQFGGGGSGADLIVDAPPAVDVAKGTTTSAWAKASGSYLERTATITLDPPGSTTDVTSLTSIGSLLAGVDVTPDGGDIRAGAFGGYTAAYTDFGGAVTEATYGGVSGGGYLAYNNGEMYADVTGKVDYLGVTYNFGGSTAETTALNLGLAANAGYRMSAGNAFVEPLGSFQVLSTSIADVGFFDFSDALSVKAGAGARIGTEIASEGLTTEVSLLARVWNEFGGPNTVTLDDGVNVTTATENIAGLYGEIAATATFLSLDSGLSGFVTGGATFGATSVDYTAKGGLRVGF